MTRLEIINLYRTLGKIRTGGISDAGIKAALIYDRLTLYRHARENDDFVAGLRENGDMEAANLAYGKYMAEDVDVTLEKVGRGALAKAVAATDTDVFLAELETLEPIIMEEE